MLTIVPMVVLLVVDATAAAVPAPAPSAASVVDYIFTELVNHGMLA